MLNCAETMLSSIKVYTIDYMNLVFKEPNKALSDVGIIINILSKQTVTNKLQLKQSLIYLNQVNSSIQKCLYTDKPKLINTTLDYLNAFKKKLNKLSKADENVIEIPIPENNEPEIAIEEKTKVKKTKKVSKK